LLPEVSFTRLNRISTVFASLFHARSEHFVVVEVQNGQASRQRRSWRDVVSELDTWESSENLRIIGRVLIEVLDLSPAVLVSKGAVTIFPGVKSSLWEAVDHIQNDVLVIIDYLAAALHC
jgi:hypothetical protein